MVLNLQQVVAEVLVPQVVHQLQALLEEQVVLVNNIQFQELLHTTLVVVGVLVLQVVKVAAVEEETETKVVAQVGQGAIDQVNLTQVQVAITAVAQVQTDQNTPAQALTSPTQAATTFDAIAQTNPTVSQPVQAAVSPVTNPSPAATPTPSPSPSTLKGGISS